MLDSTSELNREVGSKIDHVSVKKICFFKLCCEKSKIKRSRKKDLTCVSPSDNIILIASTSDSGNVYAISLLVKRESSWNEL